MSVRLLLPRIALLACFFVSAAALAAPVSVVAAENFYGDVAKQIGGDAVTVASILSNPDEDPHLFEASPSVARELSQAQIAVYSGAAYDPWMQKLLAASPSANRREIDVAALVGRQPGDNPHIWYDPQTMLSFAAVLTEALAQKDPSQAAAFRARLAAFQASMHPILTKITALREAYSGTPVTATEPVFGYVFYALGLRNQYASFQLSVMNDTEPQASDVAAFEDGLKSGRVKLLVYNSQAVDAIAKRMKQIATAAHVPVIGATETQPAGLSYQQWLMHSLADVQTALAGESRERH